MTLRKVLIYGFLAIMVAAAFWVGGYFYFIGSDDWRHVKEVVSKSEFITSEVGAVKDISTSPFGFSYKFKGDWARVKLNLLISGDKKETAFKATLEKSNNKWEVMKISQR